MASQELEPCLRMAISNIQVAASYVQRIPGHPASVDAALRDMDRAVAHLRKFAERKQINLRESMQT